MYKWMAVWIKTARLATCIFFPCPFTIRMMLKPGTFQVMLLFLFCFVSSCVGGGGCGNFRGCFKTSAYNINCFLQLLIALALVRGKLEKGFIVRGSLLLQTKTF